jgi:uncharacterized RDD family membrane protein YckC
VIGVGRPIAVRRVLARAVDLFIVLVVFSIPRAGTSLAILAALSMDAIPGGSLGKRIFGLSIKRADGKPTVSMGASAFRNLPIAGVLLLTIVPVVGWLLAGVLALVTMAFETSLLYSDRRGQRVFDILASTIVVDSRIRDAGPRPRQSGELPAIGEG